MNAFDLLAHVRRLGGLISVEGGRLRVNGPKGMLTPELQKQLKDGKDEILAILGDGVTRANPSAPPLCRVPRSDRLPLSFAQQRLWVLHHLITATESYNAPQTFRLRGDLDVEVLGAAFTALVERHESLRTVFVTDDGTPFQVIGPAHPLRIVVEDPPALPGETLVAAAERAAAIEVGRPFALDREEPLRVRLFRIADRDHLLIMVLHHIVTDGWSLGVMARELGALYEAFSAGRPSPLPELPIQYADYAVWQRQWLSGDVLDAELAYWKKQLGGAPSALDLPLDRPRPPMQSYRGDTLPVALSRELSAGLGALSRREGVTLFMTLLAALQVLLQRYTGQDDVVVGAPISGRTHIETEGLIGFFVNTLVLRTDLSGEPTVRELLGRVREVTLGAYAHQEVPFEKLVEELSPVRDLGRSPLFQVTLALHNAPRSALSLGEVELSSVNVVPTTAKFDLSLSLFETEEGIRGGLEYSTDLFDAATAERMRGHYEVLLEGIVAQPDRRVSELPLLTAAERRQVVVAWNDTKTAYPEDRCIHALFEAQAKKTPEAVAVVFEEQRLTYRELNERANQLAHHLRRLGVGPEVLVGLCVERSLSMVVGLLGILKAGGAYVPLDPAYPKDRLAFMLEDTSAPVLLTQERLLPTLPEHRSRVLRLDADWATLADERTDNPVSGAGPDNLAYVIYTSGSTGRPKGVLVEHRGVVRLVSGADYARFTPDEVFLQLAPLAFDAATFEIWGPLLNGGRLVVYPAEKPTLEALEDVLVRSQITTLWLTASLFNAMTDARPRGLASLRRILVGGEALSVPHVQKALAALEGVSLVNGYGPTEGTTFTTCFPITSPVDTASIPIGRPIANTRAYVLDAHLSPLPVGVPGELYVGGAGVARGYLNRPELTAERFLPDPFCDEPGARLYKTGDLCRWSSDGNLEYLGRMDYQVKLRGFRIELGEIESVLTAHAAIREVVVLAREDVPGDKRLVAYLVAREAPIPGVSELRNHLQSRLPDYMVPSAFVELSALPLTPNGKVDRRALPAPGGERLGQELDVVAPRTPVEEVLAGIWAEVLRLDRVSVFDNFFALGGHSLLATQVLGRLRPVFGVDVPLRALFEAPTVAGLGARVETALRAGMLSSAPRLVAVPREGTLPLSFAQQRLWFLDRLEPDSAAYNIPAVVRLSGPLDVSALARSFAEIVIRHEALRTAFTTTDGEAGQEIARELELSLPVIDVQPADVGRHAEEDAQRPFDLASGPLLRTTLLRLHERAHVLLLTMHHIVSDGWSMGVLVRELGALYEAFAAGRPSPLPALPIQYADYAVWQRQWLSGDVLEAELAYWKEQLGGAPPALLLPTDRPRPPVQTHRGIALPLALSRELSAGLGALSRREGVTLFMTLLAAFQVLLQRYTGQDDIAVGSPIAGRAQVETEGLIGFFVNTLVLRTDLSGEPTVRELLGRVREVTLGAYAHQDVPFEKLVEALAPVRETSRSPLFQVMLILQNAPLSSLSLGEVELGAVAIPHTTSKFEITLSFGETEEGIRGALEYSTDLFDAATIDRMLGHYQTLLEGMVAEPERRVSELPMLTAAERRQVVVAWNDTKTAYPEDRCIHALFEAQAKKTPEAVAVVFEEQRLTYQALNERANQLAHHLRGLGVGPEVLVGLCVERSLSMVVGLLGILKAGGAYVPLDPAYPKDRLAFMLEDTSAPVLLTQERLLPTLPEHRSRVLCLDADWATLADERTDNPVSGAGPDNLAYVIYTSGSTGRPKGVLGTHRSSVNRFAWMWEAYPFQHGEVCCQKTTLSFVDAVWEIFGPLLCGVPSVLVPEDLVKDVARFVCTLADARVTRLVLVPSLLRAMLDLSPDLGSRLPDLRHWTSSGEALPEDLHARFAQGMPDRVLLNLFGSSEVAADATCFDATAASAAGSVPIGRPIANTHAYVLDAHRHPVPVGVPGELYIGGLGVARGYLNRPELTAERFLQDPFRDEPGARLFKTGDLCRQLPDGNLSYLGRIDHQVKSRGYRIELGEIESVLTAHPAVREVVVLAREDAPGDMRLVAYLVAREAPLPGMSELRSYLQSKLPEYMVPAAFVELLALPLTPNGKVDRRSLPSPDGERQGHEHAFVAPRTPTEEVLAEIWAEVLRLDRVGVTDDFFAAGGHSLLGTRVMARLGAAFGVEMPLRALFEAPTVARLAERVDAARESGARPPVPRLVAMPRNGLLPVSFTQQRLWFLDQLEPGSAAYNMPWAVRLDGPLDSGALERSLGEIVRRHEVLRTTFVTTDGEPCQVISAPSPFTLRVVDLEAWPEATREQDAQRLTAEEARRPFELSRGPLFRATLLRLSALAHVLLTTVHHIVSDGWSLGLLAKEISVFYAAFSASPPESQAPSPLPDLPIQYADYAIWQREWLSGAVLETQIAYWREQLGGAPATLDLPSNHARSEAQSHRGAVQSLVLPHDLSTALRALARRSGVTLFMTLLAGFQVLLHRYSGQDDIVVGSPIAGRTRVETEGLIGFFINTLVLRTRLAGEPTFSEVLARVREVTLGAYAHQDVPFEKLVEALAPARDLGRTPLFQVFFNMLNLPELRQGMPGLSAQPWGSEEIIAKFDLNLYVAERAGDILLRLVYNIDMLDSIQTEAMLSHLVEILRGATASPDLPIARLPLTLPAVCEAPAETIKGLPGPRFETFARPATGQSVTRRFEQQARLRGDATAIRAGGGEISYAALDASAERVAAAIDPTTERVALLFESGPAMVAAILGVLKAGAAYVPLDLASPAERLADMIEDSGATVLLTHAACLGQARSIAPQGCLVLDIDTLSAGSTGATRPARVPVSPDAIAYILYTSGSTGRPKGVVQSHRNVLAHLRNYTNRLFLDADDVIALVASYASDAGVQDIFGALLNGAVLYPIDVARDGLLHLATRLREGGVTFYHSTPTVYRHLVSSLAEGEQLPRIRRVVLGGEESQRSDVESFRRHFRPDCIFVNGLGLTESTLALHYHVDRDTIVPRETVPVGYPVEGVEVSLVNAAGEQMAVYGAGEIVLRSAQLALGYWQRAERTAAAFSTDQRFAGDRAFRTGDLARRIPGGALEHLGRIDDQVKIRGYRVEPGEVAGVLGQHPEVKHALVIAMKGETSADTRLVAYLVPRGADSPGLSASELHEALRAKLPAYMVPSAFVRLDALPLLPNGKVDRSALPPPERLQRDEGHVAPRTPTEEVMAGIWAEVLHLDRVGATDDFFVVGGHSLLATQVIARVRAAFGIELPLRALFEAPTVAGLGARVDVEKSRGARPAAAPIPRAPREEPPPLSPTQQRMWLLDRLEPGNAAYNLSAALHLEGALDARALDRSLAEIVARHEALRTTFATIDGEPRQVISAPSSWTLPVVDLEPWPEEDRWNEARRLATDEARTPFDLARGPLFRTTLLRLTDRSHVLLWTLHHIVSDGWSTGVLARELSALYSALSAGRPSPLPTLPIQVADHAIWQLARLSGGALQEQLGYWREQLRGAPPALDLPTDRPRLSAQSYRGAVMPLRLPGALVKELSALCRREGVTLFMALLAAFQTLLHRCSGQDDIVVGSPIAGRAQVESEGLIGFFVNTLALRARFDGDPTFREVLAVVRETTLGAYAHQDVPFEKLVEELAPARDPSRAPLFQAMLVLQNAAPVELSLGDLTAEWLSVERATAKFDITLTLGQTDDGLAGALEYATDLFDPATMERFLGRFDVLLAGIVGEPGQRVSELPIVPDAERDLLAAWNATERAYPRDTLIHELFEEQASKTPEASALLFESGTITYRELDARSNRLAHHLIALGVGPGALVGLFLDRSPEMVVGLLGILKAGAGYVPLDPGYPDDRLAFVIEDAELRWLVTDERLAGSLPAHPAQVVHVGAASAPAPGALDTSPRRRARATDHAYAIYTSGSTGRPKGVLGTHRNAVNRFSWMWEAYPFKPLEVCCQKTSLSFVDSIWEIFGPLLRGVPAVVVPVAVLKDVPRFVRVLADAGVTRLVLVPSLLRVMLDIYPDLATRLPRLKHWTSSGETLSEDVHNRFVRAMPGRVLLNLYGSSEVAADVTCFEAADAVTGRVPIGRPIANTRLYLLDARRQPVPIGVHGELHVGGEGVARGYLRRPELTAERFVSDPFSSDPDARLFRTGDICGFRADGNLEYVGRRDHQVKIRGHRIELGEIEAVIAELPAVAAAVVAARAEPHSDARLVAYVVYSTVPARGPDAARELRDALRARLPEHMIPSAFVELDALPLLPSGKVDRTALPAPVADQRAAGVFARPGSAFEAELIAIWTDLLPARSIGVGVDDDFFALGGHSLLAVRLFDRIEKRFGKSLPIATLFQAPTIARLAALLASEAWVPSWSSLVPIQTSGSRRPFFCVHAVGGNVLNYRLLSRYLGDDQPFYGLQSRGLGGEEEPHERVEDMAAAYIDELCAVQPRGPYAIGGASSGGVVAYEMAQQLRARGAEVAILVLMDTNLSNPPPPRLVAAYNASSLHRRVLRLDDHVGNMLLRSPREGLRYLIARVRANLDGTAAPRMETMRAAAPAVRRVLESNFRALQGYTPRPYLGEVMMLLSNDEPARATFDRRLAWSELVESGLRVRFMPGDHETMLEEPQVAEVAAVLARCLEDRG